MPLYSTEISETAHGGFCCGMSHIHTFPATPATLLAVRPKLDEETWAENRRTNPGYYGLSRNEAYPAETAIERLKRVIKAIEEGRFDNEEHPEYRTRRGRPRGIIEVVLTQLQKPEWQKELEGLGFKLVNSNPNSNTSNTIYVYHRNGRSVA